MTAQHIGLNEYIARVKARHPGDAETERGGVKLDAGKPQMALVPPEALEEIAAVLTFGAAKYDPDNWRKGMAYRRVLSAALRHCSAWMRGEDNDPETGLSHLAHAACSLMFLITYEKTNTGTDDRYQQLRGKHDSHGCTAARDAARRPASAG